MGAQLLHKNNLYDCIIDADAKTWYISFKFVIIDPV